MAHKKGHRRSHSRRHGKKKTMLNKTIKTGYSVASKGLSVASKGFSVAKQTSRKYMPKVKSGIETLGSNVTEKAKETVPYLRNITRRVFDMINSRTRKSGRSRGFIF